VLPELAPAVVREVDAMPWEPEFDRALEPLHRKGLRSQGPTARLTVEIENPIES
jgi:hypothetical protein